MPVFAKIKFTQGLNIGNPGEALFGIVGASVVVENNTTAGIANYTFELRDVPAASALAPGVVQDGGLSSYTFVPDATGGYLFRLTVKDASGLASVDERTFGVRELSGRFVPAFLGKGSAFNFAGQLRGWALFLERWLRFADGDEPIANVFGGVLDDVPTLDGNGDAANTIRLTGNPTVTGFANGYPGRRLTVLANSATVTLNHQDVGSVAANRITTQTAAPIVIADGAGIVLQYDASRWRVISL